MNIDTIREKIARFIYENWIDEFDEAPAQDFEALFNGYINQFRSEYGEDYISIETDVLVKHGPIAAAIIMTLSYKSIDFGDRKEFSAAKISMISKIFKIPANLVLDEIEKLKRIYHEDGVFLAVNDDILYFFHDLSC